MAAGKETALRKRQQIDSSKRTMFLSVAAAALVAGAGLVVAYFLVQQIIFHTKVIGEKQATLDTLKSNLTKIEELKSNIRVLDTNTALKSVQTDQEASAVQVVLDALPSESNADALGASLQTKFAGAVNGLRVESLQVFIPDDSSAKSTTIDSPSINFTMTVSGSAAGLKELLTRFEKSIRAIDMSSVHLQATSDQWTMTVQGQAFYEPAREIKLEAKVVRP